MVSGNGERGWPTGVVPPSETDWEISATAWLLDCCAPDLRAHAVLRRHPVVLARFAAVYAEAAHRAAGTGLAEARTVLDREVAVETIQQAVGSWQAEQQRWLGVQRSVWLLERALRERARRSRGRP